MNGVTVKQAMKVPLNVPLSNFPVEMHNCEIVHELLERCLVSNELTVPRLPEVAVRVVRVVTAWAHALADFTVDEATQLARDLLVTDAAYRDLGLTPADGEPLFDSAATINAELDRYLAP